MVIFTPAQIQASCMSPELLSREGKCSVSKNDPDSFYRDIGNNSFEIHY